MIIGVGLALARRALEGLGGRVQIARAVVDDGDALHHADALVPTGGARAPGRPWPAPRPSASTMPAARDGRQRIGGGRGGISVCVGSQTSRKRRSQSSRLRPATVPTSASRGAPAQRCRARRPRSRTRSAAISSSALPRFGRRRARRAAQTQQADGADDRWRTRATCASHSSQSGGTSAASHEKPSLTKTSCSALSRRSADAFGGSCTVKMTNAGPRNAK